LKAEGRSGEFGDRISEHQVTGKLFAAAAVLSAAIAIALGSAWWMLSRVSDSTIVVGPWQASPFAGSVNAGLYTRARIALGGLFALNRAEAIYFGASRDDNHRPLRASCSYLVVGSPPAARWWSITAYGDDNYLIANAANRFSYNMRNLEAGADGAFKLIASPVAQPGNWLPTGTAGGGFKLLFRLYDPAADVAANPAAARLPSIRQVGDCP
jgi:hypothetical protein